MRLPLLSQDELLALSRSPTASELTLQYSQRLLPAFFIIIISSPSHIQTKSVQILLKVHKTFPSP